MTLARLSHAVLSLSLLAACGVDGEPVAPSQSPAQPGVVIQGKAEIGIVGS